MTLPTFLQRLKKFRLVLLRRVMGDSMVPALRPGTIVVGLRVHKVSVGDIVIVHHDGLDKIKRVQQVRPGAVFLAGDNISQSTDSRHFGWLDHSLVIAKVVWPNRKRRMQASD